VAAVDDAGLAAAVAQITAQWTDEQQARSVRVLPARVEASALHIPDTWTGSPWSVPLGVREPDLAPAMLDFMTERHLNVFGAKNCGKTHLLASIIGNLCARYTPDQVQFLVVDLKGSRLVDAVDDDYLLRWTQTDGSSRNGLVLTGPDLEVAVAAVANAMKARMPHADVTREQRRSRSWWTGPEVFIVVDDFAMVHNANPAAFAPLASLWGNAHQLGVHAVVACPIAVANRVLPTGTSLMKFNADLGSATLVMDGVKENGPILAGVRVAPLPPGRGVLAHAGRQEMIQTPVVAELESGPAGY
jgi:S-DNA-T family DNA segregation ATPase FtsK/SpoIIIE